MRPALFLTLLTPGLVDVDSLSNAATGCGACHKPQRSHVARDVPENTPQTAPEFELVDSQRIGPFSDAVGSNLRVLGMTGTDLGISFERNGKLYFLFGDTWPYQGADGNLDTLAVIDSTPWPANDQPTLRFLNHGNRPQGLRVPGVDLGGMNVPVEGVSMGRDTYLFFDTGFDEGWGRHEESVLAVAHDDDYGHLSLVHRRVSERFINLSIVDFAGEQWIFGSGSYRQSAVYLAHVTATHLGDRDAWRYVKLDAAGRSDVDDEMQASQVANDPCVGEMSVRFVPALQRLVMTYNCDNPRGVVMRTATHPAGPWSQGTVIFDPGLHGYGKFMHQPNVADGLSEPGREDQWGGEYGPYLVPSWSSVETNGEVSLIYVLSSWNPYQTHLIQSRLRRR